MENEQDVRLEIAAAVEVDAYSVMRLVQELRDVPQDAWCEVRNVWSTRHAPTTTTIVQMACERRVADFLCQRFAKKTHHVSQGEVLLVCCRRVFLRSSPTPRWAQRVSAKEITSATHHGDTHIEKPDSKPRPTALSRATMIDLLDCLGDDIVEVLAAFQAFAEPGEMGTAHLTMLGVVQALEKLSQQEWKIATNPMPVSDRAEAKHLYRGNIKSANDIKTQSVDRLAIHEVRHFLSQLVTHGAVAVTIIPEKNDVPFIVYTDFIACYVAYMSSSLRASSSSRE